jgi:hypothetical protein
VISGFRRDVDDICAVLGHYAALSGSSVPMFRDNQSVPSSTVKNLEDVKALYRQLPDEDRKQHYDTSYR